MEGINKIPEPKVITVDLSESWDTQSQVEIFFNEIRNQPFYRPDLLYSGFSAADIGKNSSETLKGSIFAGGEKSFDSDEGSNPLRYALMNDEPVIAVYDPHYLSTSYAISKEGEAQPMPHAYEIKDYRAVIAIVKLVGV